MDLLTAHPPSVKINARAPYLIFDQALGSMPSDVKVPRAKSRVTPRAKARAKTTSNTSRKENGTTVVENNVISRQPAEMCDSVLQTFPVTSNRGRDEVIIVREASQTKSSGDVVGKVEPSTERFMKVSASLATASLATVPENATVLKNDSLVTEISPKSMKRSETTSENRSCLSDCIESCEPDAILDFSASEIKMYRDIFNMYDQDGNSSIDKMELKQILEELGYECTTEEVVQVLQKFDLDSTGTIDFDEFLHLIGDWMSNDETQIRDAFEVFDKEGNGYLTLEQLKHALTKYGEEFADNEAEEFFQQIDIDGDGTITADEFIKYTKGVN